MLFILPILALAVGCAAAPAASGYWYESIEHNGISPTITNGKNWKVFRNVKDYGAKGDGTTDDTVAIQQAINTGDSTGTRDAGRFGSTGQPAVVYFPAGTYVVKSTIKSAIGTVIMGDPTNLPTLKAAAGFTGTTLLFGRDQRYSGLIGFFHGVKNLILDSTAVSASKTIALLEWSVSQNNQLSNVVFNMPVGAATHTGITMQGMNSGLIINDLEFRGGGVGVLLAATQYHLKSLVFKNVKTGIKISSLLQGTAQGLRFEDCSIGIDASSGSGMLSLIDSSATNTSVVITAAAMSSSSVTGSLVLENVNVDSSVAATIKTGSTTTLTGSTPPNTVWIRGNTYPASSTTPSRVDGSLLPLPRPSLLINTTSNSYPLLPPPTYASYPPSAILNVKTSSPAAAGDGVTDDTAALQAILAAAAKNNQVVYFPHGIYLLTDTLTIPPGSRLVGEAWTQLSASGAKFADAAKPRAMLRVGEAGSRGVAQLSDFIFTVADVLPGAVLVEVNMSPAEGGQAGDVGFWNCHFRVGGARGSAVRGTKCAKPEGCLAARLSAHLTEGSGSYWENVWSWVADHDLDESAGGQVYPGAAAGFLVEARRGTWILGMGVEHHVLYQVNINKAENVFIGLQEGEAAYWQGKGNTVLAPAPWTQSLLASDPDFAWCGASEVQCRMGLYQRVSNSKNISIYSSGFWNFVAGPQRQMCSDDCQDNAALYEGNEKFSVFGFSTINNKNLLVERSGQSTAVVAARAANPGSLMDGLFKTASVAGYFR
ncbi:glucan endo-1,3-beta-glucosidase [Staphylotrichum tortipilum]|uniref:Glucan endo-1,3-beta-glucosidase n=1 Tax=Staphylotrichum tortipilum TaxID=2831512 RepID=A0AAN6MDV7_9PEZI|nr:glucan endo-1,3-beta-glucosidase [Staphylotrichum longicolle]